MQVPSKIEGQRILDEVARAYGLPKYCTGYEYLPEHPPDLENALAAVRTIQGPQPIIVTSDGMTYMRHHEDFNFILKIHEGRHLQQLNEGYNDFSPGEMDYIFKEDPGNLRHLLGEVEAIHFSIQVARRKEAHPSEMIKDHTGMQFLFYRTTLKTNMKYATPRQEKTIQTILDQNGINFEVLTLDQLEAPINEEDLVD